MSSGTINHWIQRGKDPSFALQIIQLIRFSAVFIVSVLLVKAGVSTSTIGSYEYVLYLASILTGIWSNGVFQSFLLQGGNSDAGELGNVFRKYSYIVFGFSILLFFILWLGGERLMSVFGLTGFPDGFLFFMAFQLIFNGSYLVALMYFIQGKVGRLYVFGASFFIVYVASFSLFLMDEIELEHVFQVLGIAGCIYFLWWLVVFSNRPGKGEGKNVKIQLSGFSVLILVQAIAALSIWSDSWWVQFFYGTGDDFAVFRYGAREFPLFIILNSAFGTAMIGYLSSRPEAGMERIRKGSKRFIYGFALLYALLIVLSGNLFEAFYSKEFMPSSVVFDMYLTIVVIRVVFPRTVLIGHRFYRGLLGISLLELGMNLFLSYFLHQLWGVTGLIVATVFAHVLESIVMIVYLRVRKGVKSSRYIPVSEYIGFVIFVFIIFGIKYYIVGLDSLLIFF